MRILLYIISVFVVIATAGMSSSVPDMPPSLKQVAQQETKRPPDKYDADRFVQNQEESKNSESTTQKPSFQSNSHPTQMDDNSTEDLLKEVYSINFGKFLGKTVADPTAFYTLILTAFTGVLSVSTIALWLATRNLVKLAREQAVDTRRAIQVAEVSAKAAEKSASVAEQSLIDIERALIVPSQFRVDILSKDQNIIGNRITVEFINSGNTAGKAFTGSANFLLTEPNKTPEDFLYSDMSNAAPASGTIGPQVRVPFPINIPLQNIIAVQNKAGRGFVYGWVEYSDIFTTSAKRRTEFCVEVEVIGDPKGINPVGGSSHLGFKIYGKYNGTDHDCVYKPGERPPVRKILNLTESLTAGAT